MPYVTIEWFEGRSGEQKRVIAERLTDVLSEEGKMPRDQVWIRFVDAKKADWSIAGELQDAGGTAGAASEPALGPPD